MESVNNWTFEVLNSIFGKKSATIEEQEQLNRTEKLIYPKP